MTLPSTQVDRFIGKLFVSDTPPGPADIGGPLEAGHMYLDTAGSDDSLCVYNGTDWDCVVLSASAPTTTSTTTSTTTT